MERERERERERGREKTSFRRWWVGFGKSQLGAWGERTKAHPIRSTPIFWQCTGHRHWGEEKDASNRGIPWWGGNGDGAPIESTGVSLLEWNRLAKGRWLRRRRHHRWFCRCCTVVVVVRCGAFIVQNPQSIYIYVCACVFISIYIYIYRIQYRTQSGKCLAWPTAPSLGQATSATLSPSLSFSLCLPIFPSQCLVAVVYVILLFHIVPFKKPQRRSSWWNRGTPEIYGRSRVNMRRAQRVDFLTFQFYWKRNEWFLLSRETRLFRWILAEGWRIIVRIFTDIFLPVERIANVQMDFEFV